MAMWSPWRGCHRFSEGCTHCYIHRGDAKRGVDTDAIAKTEGFARPVEKNKKGEYRMKGGQLVFVCFQADFLIEEADPWRQECWQMMGERQDLHFLFLTKRIQRLGECLPPDWGEGYDNVTIGCTVENQKTADERLPVFQALPIKHRNIILQPLLGPVEISPWLAGTELTVVGGESGREARPLHYDWVLEIRDQCIRQGVPFQFRQCGSRFIKEGKEYKLNVRELCSQARKAGIDWGGAAP